MAVFPLLDITVLELPDLEDNVSEDQLHILTVTETESFQWVCTVEAGLGDELLWLHNGELIPSATNISQVNYWIVINDITKLSSFRTLSFSL